MKITDELITYETAVLAKEIGFDREVQYYFDEGKVINTWHSINPLFAKRLGLILAPSQRACFQSGSGKYMGY